MLKQMQQLIDKQAYEEAIAFACENLESVENDYFAFFILYIEALMANHQYEQAKSLLQEELSMPYIPMIYEPKLNELLTITLSYLKQNDSNHLDEVTLKSDLISDDAQKVMHALFQLESHNIRNFLDTITVFLEKKSSFDFEKSIVIDLMRQQQINQFFFVNKCQQEVEINPYTLEPIYATTYLIKCCALIEQALMKYPTYKKLVLDIIKSYCYTLYPLNAHFEAESLVKAVINYIFTVSQFNPDDEQLVMDVILYEKIKTVIEQIISM